MKKTSFFKALSVIVCIVLIAAIALFTIGCSDKSTPSSSEITGSAQSSNVLGEGSTLFNFTVTDADGKETAFEIHTDKKTVGEALLELNLISGDQGNYGLYVKTVNGIALDYDKDGKYWAFYVNGEYGMSGVDATDIEAGATYSFKVE